MTFDVVDDVKSLRRKKCMLALWTAFASAKDQFGFRLVHFCVMSKHVHMMVEVDDRKALLRGMRGLLVRVARQLNKALSRKGQVIADRYHVEMLDNFRRLRFALAYVIQNERRHCFQHGGRLKPSGYLDPCSSASFYFDGWRGRIVKPPDGIEPPVTAARGFPLREGWKRHGLIAVDEIPSMRRERSAI